MDMLMDLFVLALLVIILWGIKIKPRGFFDDYLSKDCTGILKGIFAVVVIFHHLSQRTGGGLVFPLFQGVGYLAVAVFFFASGYGLMVSFAKKGEAYSKHFFRHRLPPVLLPFIVILILYKIYFLFYEGKSIQYLWEKLIWESNTWYVIALLVLYIFFGLSIKLLKKPEKIIAAMFAGTLIYCCACFFIIRDQFWWYNSCFSLNLGLIFGLYGKSIDSFIKRNWIGFLLGTSALLAVKFTFAEGLQKQQFYQVVTYQEAALLFCLLIVLISMKIKIGNKVLSFLGDISYELYLFHGLIILAARSWLINIQNNLLFSAVVIFASIPIAFGLHKLFKFILSKIQLKLA